MSYYCLDCQELLVKEGKEKNVYAKEYPHPTVADSVKCGGFCDWCGMFSMPLVWGKWHYKREGD